MPGKRYFHTLEQRRSAALADLRRVRADNADDQVIDRITNSHDPVRNNWEVGDVVAFSEAPGAARWIVDRILPRENGAVAHTLRLRRFESTATARGHAKLVPPAQQVALVPVAVAQFHSTDGHRHRGALAYRRRRANITRAEREQARRTETAA